jgi:hypothetical protein
MATVTTNGPDAGDAHHASARGATRTFQICCLLKVNAPFAGRPCTLIGQNLFTTYVAV